MLFKANILMDVCVTVYVNKPNRLHKCSFSEYVNLKTGPADGANHRISSTVNMELEVIQMYEYMLCSFFDQCELNSL